MSSSSRTSQSYLNYDKSSLNDLPCHDALIFQQKLQKFRQFDDKIINILNSEIPTESFYSERNPAKKCVELNNEIQQYYKLREDAIKKCVDFAKNEISVLKQNTAASDNNNKFLLREKQFNLRQFEEELTVEEIIRSRSLKAIKERCRSFI